MMGDTFSVSDFCFINLFQILLRSVLNHLFMADGTIDGTAFRQVVASLIAPIQAFICN